MYKYLVLIFVSVGTMLFGQVSDKYASEYANFYRAEELFQKEQYGAARYEFRSFINQFNKPNDPLFQKALYYEGLSALELYNNDAVQLLVDFNRNYPESIYKTAIFFRLGQYFYQKKDYKEALSWLKQIEVHALEEEYREEYYFKLGYANFQEQHFVLARNAFHEIKDGESTYSGPALYYYSHILYQDKSYQVALEGFMKLTTHPQFSKIVPYYIVQIYHLQGRYQEVTDYAPSALDTNNVQNVNDMNHLLGDAYFHLKKYDEAIPYLAEYNKKSKTTRDDDYQLGFSYYRAGMNAEAIKLFNQVTAVKDSLGQTAYYHIGECFLKLDKLSAARAAFEEASKVDANASVEEDALYNYAILSYKLDINPYDEAVEALQFYLKRYPNSSRKNDVYQYLVNVYTSTNKYEKALQSLDKIPSKDTRLKSAYQIVAFNRGVELYQKVEYLKAIATFELVENYPIDPVISGKAKFWLADAYFQLKNYERAIQEYKNFLSAPATLSPDLKKDAYYNIGYAYYYKHDTLLGIESFRTYTQQSNLTNKHKLADAFMRVADGSYATRQNENAIKYYQEVLKLKSGYEDQALYYLAKTYGYTNNFKSKIAQLQDLVNNYSRSKYMLSAIEELATTFKSIGEYDKAKQYFELIINDYPTHVMVKQARLEIADIYYKKQQFDKSEIAYLQVLDEFGSDRVICEAGAKGLIAIYEALRQPEKALATGEKYPCAGMTKNQQEELFFNPAKKSYNDSLDPVLKTAGMFEKYLEKFPSGIYANDAKNYLADCYYRLSEVEKAIPLYIETLKEADNNYTELAAIRVSKYLFNHEQYADAIPYYKRLLSSTKPDIVYNSRLGLMRSNFLLEQWTESAHYAQLMLDAGQKNPAILLEVNYALGLSNYKLQQFEAAKPALEWLVKNTTTVTGAEAKYLLAEMYFLQKAYDKSDAEVRALLKMKPSYNYWVAKGLILQSRTLIIKEDLFQAEETLKSVIEHYPIPDDGIIADAQLVMDEVLSIKNKEKEIEPKSSTVIELNEGNQ